MNTEVPWEVPDETGTQKTVLDTGVLQEKAAGNVTTVLSQTVDHDNTAAKGNIIEICGQEVDLQDLEKNYECFYCAAATWDHHCICGNHLRDIGVYESVLIIRADNQEIKNNQDANNAKSIKNRLQTVLDTLGMPIISPNSKKRAIKEMKGLGYDIDRLQERYDATKKRKQTYEAMLQNMGYQEYILPDSLHIVGSNKSSVRTFMHNGTTGTDLETGTTFPIKQITLHFDSREELKQRTIREYHADEADQYNEMKFPYNITLYIPEDVDTVNIRTGTVGCVHTGNLLATCGICQQDYRSFDIDISNM